jgi:hypothetical protein
MDNYVSPNFIKTAPIVLFDEPPPKNIEVLEGSTFNFHLKVDAHFAVSGTVLIDVTNASTFRWKLNVEPSSTSIFFGGGSSNKTMGAVFIKLGET